MLNEWAARELGASVGDAVRLEYYLWEDAGRLSTRSAEFRLAGVVPFEGVATDRDLVPEYPGITGAKSLADWDPPFPLDLSRIRPQDEDYWDKHRTTPKAFVTLARGQELWRTRFGGLTSLRFTRPEGAMPESALETFSAALRETLDPSAAGLTVYAVRAEGLAASRGATDFGEYFLYFSFFIVVSALLLTALFFRLGVEQRLREIGLLRRAGLHAGTRARASSSRRLCCLRRWGVSLGVPGAYAYGWLLMKGLRTWWVGAVGTTALELHAGPWPFVFGVAGGVAAALVCIVWTLRGLRRASARSLLSGAVVDGGLGDGGRGDGEAGRRGDGGRRRGRVDGRSDPRRLPFVAGASRSPSPRLPVSPSARCSRFSRASRSSWRAAVGALGQAAGFFGGGALLLVALLGFQSAWLRGGRRGTI